MDHLCRELLCQSRLWSDYPCTNASHGYELIEEYLPHDYVNWYFRPKIEG